MERLDRADRAAGGSAFHGLARLGGAIAWIGATAVGAVMAVFFAATLVVIALMASAVLALAAAAAKAGRTVRAPVDPGFIDAHHVGGHSWVAYGWDGGPQGP